MIQPAFNSFQPAADHRRPPKSFADYAAIAICPVLIMLAVGALVFFLVDIGYAGSHLGKLRWTLFWFVLAMVLVSRIAIEKGYDQAGIYGLGLAAATGFVVTQYVNNYLGVWCILGLIWWATNKLTWDCTVIDDDLDASGEGLLQAAKLDLDAKVQTGTPSSDSDVFPSLQRGAATQAKGTQSKTSRWKLVYRKRVAVSTEPHAPGLWVIYFSLAALLAFGLGQGLISAGDTAARQRAFLFIVIYLAAALGLLLITSFLGLRRYLRQRHLVMPPAISATWVSMGSTLGLAILVGSMLLPRPSATWSLTAMIDRLGDPPSATSQKKDTAAEDAQRSPTQESKPEPQAPRDENNQGVRRDTDRKTGLSEAGPTAKPQPGVAPLRSSQPRWLKLAFYAVLLSVGLLLAIKNKEHLLLALRKCWEAFREFWRNLFNSKKRAAPAPNTVGASQIPSRPFAAFSNPFTSGEASAMSIRDLIVYTFNALEAWAAGFQFGRYPDQTPFEFADQLGDQVPDLSVEIQQVTRLYVQVAYAESSNPPPCQTVLEILWSKMTHTSANAPRTTG